MRYSIVIPAYNEEGKIRRTLEALSVSFPGAEVIVVDDGSSDYTASIAEASSVKVLRHTGNRGKGAAVRTGFAAATGGVVGFVDADGSTDWADVRKVWDAAASQDVAIASRRMAGAVIPRDQPAHRRLAGYLLRLLLVALIDLDVKDTQCGCKALSRRALDDVLPFMMCDGFEFDVELLYLAKKRGYRIIELPVRWTDERETKVNVLRDGLKMLGGILYLRFRGEG